MLTDVIDLQEKEAPPHNAIMEVLLLTIQFLDTSGESFDHIPSQYFYAGHNYFVLWCLLNVAWNILTLLLPERWGIECVK
jgi:hypothetical protein